MILNLFGYFRKAKKVKRGYLLYRRPGLDPGSITTPPTWMPYQVRHDDVGDCPLFLRHRAVTLISTSAFGSYSVAIPIAVHADGGSFAWRFLTATDRRCPPQSPHRHSRTPPERRALRGYRTSARGRPRARRQARREGQGSTSRRFCGSHGHLPCSLVRAGKVTGLRWRSRSGGT